MRSINFRPAVAAFAIAGFLTFLAACGGPAERMKEIEAQKPTPAPTPGEREISGSYNVTGADSNDADPYTGILTIAPQGDVYGFRWQLNKGTSVGTAVQFGNSVAVSSSATGGGKGCGVVLYRIAADGSLDGRVVRWGESKFTSEKATRVEGRTFTGKYTVSGTDADSRAYSGELMITKDGAGYDLEWKTDKPQVAFGIWKGSVAAASFGGKQCGFALYDIQSNGNLEGNWGGQRAVTFGTETAKRQ